MKGEVSWLVFSSNESEHAGLSYRIQAMDHHIFASTVFVAMMTTKSTWIFFSPSPTKNSLDRQNDI